jgi:amino acid permease
MRSRSYVCVFIFETSRTTIPRMFESNLRRNPRQRYASWLMFVILTVPPLWLSLLLSDEIVQLPFLLVFWSCFAFALLNVIYQQHQSEMNFAKVVPLGTPSIIGDDVITGSPLLKKNGSNSPYVKEDDVMGTYLY